MAVRKKAKRKEKPNRRAPKLQGKVLPTKQVPKKTKATRPKNKQKSPAAPSPTTTRTPKRRTTAAQRRQPNPTPNPQGIASQTQLIKRSETVPIGVVTVTDSGRQIEQSTFYDTGGRDEYVQGWEARGYECVFTPWNN